MAACKKNAARLGAHMVFVDEPNFLLMPNVVKIWAPRGATPIFRPRYRRDKVSVISAISVSPVRHRLGLYYQFWLNNIGHAEVCTFLRNLLRYLRGHVIVLLDNSASHKGEPLRALCRRYTRLHLEYLPPYAPELNRDEAVWSLTKRSLAVTGQTLRLYFPIRPSPLFYASRCINCAGFSHVTIPAPGKRGLSASGRLDVALIEFQGGRFPQLSR